MKLLDKIGVFPNPRLSKTICGAGATLTGMAQSQPLTLSPAARELLPELREHLGAYGVLVHQYCKHFALGCTKSGMIRRVLQTHSLQTFHHFRQVGTCMVKLGGVPLGSMLELVNQAYLEPEPEGAGSWPKMLAHDRWLEHENNERLKLTEETALELARMPTARLLATLRAAGVARVARLDEAIRDVERIADA
jgi:hypothetical protein